MRDKDGAVKVRILSTVKGGGTYVIFCNRACTKAMIESRVARMREVLRSEGPDLATVAKLDFWDANRIADWVNAHYPVALWVIERIRSGGILPFQTLERWGGDRNVAEFRFVDDPRVESIAGEIERSLADPRGVLRITGLSGLGKSRLGFEVLSKAPISLRARVLYTHGGFGAERILTVAQAIREFRKSAIVVVDDCPMDLHKALAAIVENRDSKLSLLTIDYDPAAPAPEYKSITIPRAADKVVIDIIRQVAHGVGDGDVSRLAEFAQGFPQIAVLIARAWPFDTYDISTLTDDELIKKMVFGRSAPDQKLFSLTQALSLFDTVGVEAEAIEELRFVASTAGIDLDAAYGFVRTLIERGIAQKRGRYVQVQPKPLALALAAGAWKRMTPSKIDRLTVEPVRGRLKRALFLQFAKLDKDEKARQIAEDLCALGRPFTQSTFLDDELHAECLARIAVVNPSAAIGALEIAFGEMPPEELRRIHRGRRWLVWTLEKLCFPEATFERAAALLMQFAVAENEIQIGNNATALFKSLFKLYLSGTETPAIKRLNVIDRALGSGDLGRRRIAVAALEESLEASHFMRFGGAETQGTGPILEDWSPSTRAEQVEYYRACLERLVDVACSQNDLSLEAKKYLARNIRGLIGIGLVDDIGAMVDRILASGDPVWPEAIEQTAFSLTFEGRKMSPEYRQKVEAVHERLKPRSLEHRLRLYVCELPWGYYESDTNILECAEQRSKILAKECADRWDEFSQFLPMLLKGEQRHSYALGRHIMEAVGDSEGVVDVVISTLRAIPRDERNPALLAGMLAAAEKRDAAMIDRKLDAVAANSELIRFLPWLTAQTAIEMSDLERIAAGLRSGSLLPADVRVLALGGVLSKLAPTQVAFLIDAMLEAGSAGYWAAVEIMGMYTYQRHERREELRPQLRRLVEAFDIEKIGEAYSAMDTHQFYELATWLIRHGSTDVDAMVAAGAIMLQAVRWCVESSPGYRDRRVIEKLLPEALTHCSSVAWPFLSTGIEAHRDRIWSFEGLLRLHGLDGEPALSPVFLVSWDVLRAWCFENAEFAPAFLMRLAPKFEARSGAIAAPDAQGVNGDVADAPRPLQWNPIVIRLLDDFGDRKDVLDALAANMMTFIWSGSLVPYFEQYKAPLEALLKHHRPSVVAWARRQLDAQRQAVAKEQSRDAEQEFGIF